MRRSPITLAAEGVDFLTFGVSSQVRPLAGPRKTRPPWIHKTNITQRPPPSRTTAGGAEVMPFPRWVEETGPLILWGPLTRIPCKRLSLLHTAAALACTQELFKREVLQAVTRAGDAPTWCDRADQPEDPKTGSCSPRGYLGFPPGGRSLEGVRPALSWVWACPLDGAPARGTEIYGPVFSRSESRRPPNGQGNTTGRSSNRSSALACDWKSHFPPERPSPGGGARGRRQWRP